MGMTLTVEIPALDRLCGILESRGKDGVAAAIEAEIVAKLKEAAETGTLEKAVKAPAPETAPEPRKPAQEPPKPEPTEKPAEAAAPAPAAKPERTEGAEGASAAKQDAPETRGQANGAARGATVTLADVQKAAAQMRDDGKLEAVKALFPEFGIRKLSDLNGDALQGFAERLRGMGAKV